MSRSNPNHFRCLISRISVSYFTSKFAWATGIPFSVFMMIGYEFNLILADVASIPISRSQSETQDRKNAFASNLLRSSSPLRLSCLPSRCWPQFGPKTSLILFMSACTCRSICRAQRILPLTGGIPLTRAMLEAGDVSYLWVNFDWSFSIASLTVDIKWIWNSFTAFSV